MGQSRRLEGKKVAFLATEGVEQVELTEPWKAVEEAGGTPELVALETGEVQAFNHLDKGDTFDGRPDRRATPDADDYDGARAAGRRRQPGPPAHRRGRGRASCARSSRPASRSAAICHGPWTLVEADVVRGRTLTSWPSLQTDIRNAGGNWVDEEVVVDNGLVSSRKPDDLPAFCAKLVEEICEGKQPSSDRRRRTLSAGCVARIGVVRAFSGYRPSERARGGGNSTMKTPRFMAVLVAMVALAIAGCGSDDSDSGGAPDAEKATQAKASGNVTWCIGKDTTGAFGTVVERVQQGRTRSANVKLLELPETRLSSAAAGPAPRSQVARVRRARHRT